MFNSRFVSAIAAVFWNLYSRISLCKKILVVHSYLILRKRELSLMVKHMPFKHCYMGSNPIVLKKNKLFHYKLNIIIKLYLTFSNKFTFLSLRTKSYNFLFWLQPLLFFSCVLVVLSLVSIKVMQPFCNR